MNTRVRTTITLPENLLKKAKIKAVLEKKPLSALVAEALEKDLSIQKEQKPKKRKIHMVFGKYSLGTTDTFRREEMYEEYLKHKISR